MPDFEISSGKSASLYQALVQDWEPETFSIDRFHREPQSRHVEFPFTRENVSFFATLLFTVSLHRVEAENVKSNLLLSRDDVDLSVFWEKQLPDWGFTYIFLFECPIDEFGIQKIRKSLISTENPSSFLLLQITNGGSSIRAGFLFLPIQISQLGVGFRTPVWFTPDNVARDVDRFYDFLRCCLVGRVENRAASLGTSRGWVATISDGSVTTLQDFSDDVYSSLDCCTGLQMTLQTITETRGENGSKISANVRATLYNSITRMINDLRFSSHGAIIVLVVTSYLITKITSIQTQ